MAMLTFYVQTHFWLGFRKEGLVVVSPLFLVMANTYMEYFKKIFIGMLSSALDMQMTSSYFGHIRKMWKHCCTIWTELNKTFHSFHDEKKKHLDVLITCIEYRFNVFAYQTTIHKTIFELQFLHLSILISDNPGTYQHEKHYWKHPSR